MPRVLVILNFYSLEEATDYLDAGGDQLPLHHIWCYDYLKANGFDVLFIQDNGNSWLGKLGRKLKINNLFQQVQAIKRSDEYEVVFDPFMQFTFLLAILKITGIFNKPIVAIAQRSYVVNKKNPIKRFKQWLDRLIYFKGVDRILFINKNLFDKSKDFSIKGKEDYLRSWGVENEFFQRFCEEQNQPPTEDYIYSTGGSERDFETLITAFQSLDFKLRITSRYDFTADLNCKVPRNVVIDNSIKPGLTSTGKLRSEYFNALAVALPINPHPYFFCPYGNTVLFEAMACGKPVIATDNKAFPFSIEKEGVGILVDYNDVEGWVNAINFLKDHPDKAREMGRRGLDLCIEKYSYQKFSREVCLTIEELLDKQYSHIEKKNKVKVDHR